MKLDKYVFVIFVVGYCHAYSSNLSNRQKRDVITLNFNEGDVCQEVDGVTWKCEQIIYCSLDFIKTIRSPNTKRCKFTGPTPIYCCPRFGSSLPSKVTVPAWTPPTTVSTVPQWTTPTTTTSVPKWTVPSVATTVPEKTTSAPLHSDSMRISERSGDVCREVDGVFWTCEPIIKCSLGFIRSMITTKPKRCQSIDSTPIFCCTVKDTPSKPIMTTVDAQWNTQLPPFSWTNPSTVWKPHIIRTTPPTSATTSTTTQRMTTPRITTVDSQRNTRPSFSWNNLPTAWRPHVIQTNPSPSVPTSIQWMTPAKPVVLPNSPNSRKIRISERKCKEYAELVFQDSIIQPLWMNEPPDKVNTCGIRELPLIIGGELVNLKEFPHQVLLGYKTAGVIPWLCGGILISEFFILTAGHCINHPSGAPKFALLGETSMVDYHNNSIMPLRNSYYYPGYPRSHPYNDIALIRTEREVTFDEFVRPACLETPDSPFRLLYSSESVIATGWGLTEEGVQSEDLRKVKLQIIDRDKCNSFYDFVNKIGVDNKTQVCAGDPLRKRDACSGDSGGPLQAMLETPYCMYTIIGVTSVGIRNGCGTYKASIFTRVSHYVSWIESIVWPGL